MKVLKRIGLVAILLYAVLCFVVFIGQEFLIFHPTGLSEDHQFRFARPFVELDIDMEDGTRLNAVHFTVDRPRGVVLFWHGNTGNIQTSSPIVKHFMNRRYATFICDYRGYGKSEGKRSQETMYSDGLEVYDHLRTLYPRKKIVIYGQSLGTGVGTYIAAHRDAHHLVLEAPYTSIEEIAREDFPFLPVSALLRFPMESHEYIDSVRCGITVLHGTDDVTIPQDHGRRLCAQNPRCEFVSLQGGGHNSSPLFREYQDALDMALLGYIRPDQTEVVVPEPEPEPEPGIVQPDSLAGDSVSISISDTITLDSSIRSSLDSLEMNSGSGQDVEEPSDTLETLDDSFDQG